VAAAASCSRRWRRRVAEQRTMGASTSGSGASHDGVANRCRAKRRGRRGIDQPSGPREGDGRRVLKAAEVLAVYSPYTHHEQV
jgi:hypothetical protein